MDGPVRVSTSRQILLSTAHVDTTLFEGAAALRCTVGVAIVLLVGLALGQPLVSAFGAIGAVSVGFGSFQGAYRSRAAVMIAAAAGMAVSVLLGSVGGSSDLSSTAIATAAAFASGMFVALGPSASFVGLQCVVAVLIAGGFPSDLRGAAIRAALVLGGGLVQTLLVVMIWPLRRFSAERRGLATAFRSLARYAADIPAAVDVAPEPHTFAMTMSPLVDPQPFARAGDVLVFQALLDEAERIRASLAGFVTWRPRVLEFHPQCAIDLPTACSRALFEIADALEHGRAPREESPIWAPIEACVREIGHLPAVDALLGQLRAAWRTAGVMEAADEAGAAPVHLPPLQRRPPIRDALTTLRANLTIESEACRHALRVAATVALACACYRLLQLPRGYWIPLTAVLVLRPEFTETFARALARIAGTILGAGAATVIVTLIEPGPAALIGLVLVFVWGCYAFSRMNYVLFATCLTGYVVFILMLSGVAEMTAATARAMYTVAGGLFAVGAYAVWPTWAASTARSALAAILEIHARYVSELLAAYGDPVDLDRKLGPLRQLRSEARLARSNAEATIERMLSEPASRASIAPRAAIGLLAALRRHALAALSL
ncbi:MAG: FUSC family protein, partial [Vicinamibacterales bacterium]